MSSQKQIPDFQERFLEVKTKAVGLEGKFLNPRERSLIPGGFIVEKFLLQPTAKYEQRMWAANDPVGRKEAKLVVD